MGRSVRKKRTSAPVIVWTEWCIQKLDNRTLTLTPYHLQDDGRIVSGSSVTMPNQGLAAHRRDHIADRYVDTRKGETSALCAAYARQAQKAHQAGYMITTSDVLLAKLMERKVCNDGMDCTIVRTHQKGSETMVIEIYVPDYPAGCNLMQDVLSDLQDISQEQGLLT